MDQFKKAQRQADELKKQRTAELEKRRELALKKERWAKTIQTKTIFQAYNTETEASFLVGQNVGDILQ